MKLLSIDETIALTLHAIFAILLCKEKCFVMFLLLIRIRNIEKFCTWGLLSERLITHNMKTFLFLSPVKYLALFYFGFVLIDELSSVISYFFQTVTKIHKQNFYVKVSNG